MRRHVLCLVLAAMFLLTSFAAADPPPAGWSGEFYRPGLDDRVLAAHPWQDGFVVGGAFTVAGPVAAEGVAYFDGSQWHALGAGLGGVVWAFCIHDGDLYAGGNIHDPDGGDFHGIARWDGLAWQPVGTDGPYSTEALASYDGHLYAAAEGLFRLDGPVWTRVVETDAYIHQLLVHDGLLLAGGDFHAGNGTPAVHMLGWDGSQVLAVYQGLPERPEDLVFFAGALHAAGVFELPGMPGIQWVMAWNGAAWLPLGSIPAEDHHCRDLGVAGGSLHVMGTRWPGIPSEAFLMRWTGSAWVEIVEPVAGGYFRTLFDHDGALWLGGQFPGLGEVSAPNLIRRDGDTWRAPFDGGLGADAWVLGLEAADQRLHVCGVFEFAGPLRTPWTAAWTPAGWQALTGWFHPDGTPLEPTEYTDAFAMVTVGERLLASGVWGSDPYYYTAEWSGAADHWVVQSDVAHRTYQVWGDHLYASTSDYDAGERVVRQPLAGGPWETVGQTGAAMGIRAMTLWNDRLVVGGDFYIFADQYWEGLAAFDGEDWSELGGGVSGSVYALSVHDGDLIVGGDFWIPETSIENIARFDGDQWHHLGDLATGHVHALTTYGPDLIAAGCFQDIDGAGAHYIARHDGTQWHPLDSGVNGLVSCLAVFDGSLFAGGAFSVAGGHASSNLARWTDPAVTPVVDDPGPTLATIALQLVSASPNPFNPGTTIHFSLAHAGRVRLDIVDLRGRLVRRLVQGQRSAGHHQVGWDGQDAAGRGVASGTYLVRLAAAGEVATGKITLAR